MSPTALSLVKDKTAPIPPALTNVTVIVEWESSSGGQKGFRAALNRAKGLDLDAIVGANDLGGRVVAMVGGPEGTTMLRGAVAHHGDSKGRGGGVQTESVSIDLKKVPDDIGSLVIALDAYKPNAKLGDARNVACVLTDSAGEELGIYRVPMTARNNTVVLGVIKRAATGWTIQPMSEPADGRTHDELITLMERFGRR